MLKKIFYLLCVCFCFSLLSCSSDIEDANETVTTKENEVSSNARRTRAIASSDSENITWTGEKKILKKSNVKVALGPAYSSYIGPGVYICDVYRVRATIPAINTTYKSVRDDNQCGFFPTIGYPKNIQRGTRVSESDDSEDSYVLETICFRIVASLAGHSYPKDYYIPCRPEEALLKYKIN